MAFNVLKWCKKFVIEKYNVEIQSLKKIRCLLLIFDYSRIYDIFIDKVNKFTECKSISL